MHARNGFLLTLSILMLLPGTLAAQDEPTAGSLFIDRVDVNVINVEVFVTDSQGQRVTGLGREDFELFEDGEPVEISNFYAVAREDRVIEEVEKDSREILEEPPKTKLRPLPEDQQLNLLVYVDNFNIRPQNRKRVLGDLEDFLEDRMSQGDNVMLVSYNRGIDVLEPFTRDRQAITRGLEKLSKQSTYRQIDDLERRRIIRTMLGRPSSGTDFATDTDDLSSAYQMLRSYVQSTRLDLRLSAQTMRDTVRSLAGLPGRKAMLYVSDGLPQRPGAELYQLLVDMFGTNSRDVPGGFVDPSIEALKEDESHLFDRIIREANAHQVTLYTLDARGHGSESTLSAEYSDLSAGAGGSTAMDSLRSVNLQEPLLAMAADTGGTAVINTFNFDTALATMAGDFDSFYSLGYRSPRGGDGRYHEIEVRVKRPGLKVRHRTGYVDKPEVERVADRALSSLLLDLEKNPLAIALDFGEPEKKGRNRYLLPILVRIPFDQVTLLPEGELHKGKLKIFLVVQDEEGNISDLFDFDYPLEVPSAQIDQAAGQEIGYRTTLEIRGGTPKLAVAVWDELSGTESYVSTRVLVGKEKKRGRRGP